MPPDRQRMRPWLEEQINSGTVKGLMWLNEEKGIFQIPWLHAARHGWELDKDAPLFMRWAIHTGKYHPGVDVPDPKTWKANFRCAMNSLPDIKEVKDRSSKKGTNALKVYRMLNAEEQAIIKEKKKQEKSQNKRKKKNPDCKLPSEEISQQSSGSYEADSTVNIDNHAVRQEFPEVCAVVEVSTQQPDTVLHNLVPSVVVEPPVTSSISCPRLQVSPISSCGESDAESEYSDEDLHQEWDIRCLSTPRRDCTMVRYPSSKPPENSTFFNSERINFKVTTFQEESPLIRYDARPWLTQPLDSRPSTNVDPNSPVPSCTSSHMNLQGVQPQSASTCVSPDNNPPVASKGQSLLPPHTTQVSVFTISPTSTSLPHQKSSVMPKASILSPRRFAGPCSSVILCSNSIATPQTSPNPTLPLLPTGSGHLVLHTAPPPPGTQLLLHTTPLMSPGVHGSPKPSSLALLHAVKCKPLQSSPGSSLKRALRVLSRPDSKVLESPEVLMPNSMSHMAARVPSTEKWPVSSEASKQLPLSMRAPSTTDKASTVLFNTNSKS